MQYIQVAYFTYNIYIFTYNITYLHTYLHIHTQYLHTMLHTSPTSVLPPIPSPHWKSLVWRTSALDPHHSID